jgi:hypothetical protein
MSEAQARTIINALDFYSRIGMGQFKEIKNVMFQSFGLELRDPNADVDAHIGALKKIYFPELLDAEYYGIFHPELCEESKISWDLIQVIRNGIAWTKYPDGGYTVDFGQPIQSSMSETLASVKINVVKKE